MIEVLLITLLTIIFLSACGNDLDDDLENFQADMEETHALDEELQTDIDNLDLQELQSSINDMETSLETEDLEEPLQQIDDMQPKVEELEEQVEGVEIDNNEIAEVFETYEESVAEKNRFLTELEEYLSAYQSALSSSEQLIELSQSFTTKQEERSRVIENTTDEEAADEIDEVIERVNENSEELEEEAQLLQGDEQLEDKQNHIDDVLLPLIDDHIDSLNQMILETQDSNRVRSLTLEMYYGFKTYYEERKNSILYNEVLQEYQLQNIISMKETYENLDEEYQSGLQNLERGNN